MYFITVQKLNKQQNNFKAKVKGKNNNIFNIHIYIYEIQAKSLVRKSKPRKHQGPFIIRHNPFEELKPGANW